jgi:hypothetical protein
MTFLLGQRPLLAWFLLPATVADIPAIIAKLATSKNGCGQFT